MSIIHNRESHYRDRILSGEHAGDIANEFVFDAIDALWIKAGPNSDKEFCEKFKKLNRMARSISVVSHGLEKGYVLCENWFRIVFVQFALAAARMLDDSNAIRTRLSLEKRWKMMGYDIEEDKNPVIDIYSYAVPVIFNLDDGHTLEYVMRYTLPRDTSGYVDPFTKGTILEGARGGTYTVRRREPDGVVVVWSDSEKAKDRKMTKKQMDNMTVLVAGYLVGEL